MKTILVNYGNFSTEQCVDEALYNAIFDEGKRAGIEEVRHVLYDSVPLTENSDIVHGFSCAIARIEQLKGNEE